MGLSRDDTTIRSKLDTPPCQTPLASLYSRDLQVRMAFRIHYILPKPYEVCLKVRLETIDVTTLGSLASIWAPLLLLFLATSIPAAPLSSVLVSFLTCNEAPKPSTSSLANTTFRLPSGASNFSSLLPVATRAAELPLLVTSLGGSRHSGFLV